MDVRERLRQLMDERGWSIYKVAKEADIPWSTIRNMYKRSTDPSISTLESICKSMGMTLSQFFDDQNEMSLNDEQRQLLETWSKLGDKEKILVIDLLKALDKQN